MFLCLEKNWFDPLKTRSNHPGLASTAATDLVCITGVAVRDDVGHEGAVLDVLFIAGHVDSVLPRLRRQVADIARAVVLVLTLDLGLGRPLDGEAWGCRDQIRPCGSFQPATTPSWICSREHEQLLQHCVIHLTENCKTKTFSWRYLSLTQQNLPASLEKMEYDTHPARPHPCRQTPPQRWQVYPQCLLPVQDPRL